jgi:flagellar assembly protein FliH
MARLIRNYNAGERITLSEWTREHGTALSGDSPEEVQKQAIEQARQQVEEMRRQLDAQLAQIDARSAAILDDAQIQAVTLQAEAQAKGYEAGYKQGLADGQQKMDVAMGRAVAQIAQILDEVASQRSATLAGVEAEVVALSLAIAEKIVGQIATTHEALIVHMVNRAMAELPTVGPLLLRIHPDDSPILERFWMETHKSDEHVNGWRLVPDPQIERGGCLIVCGSTTLDARLSIQLDNIAKGLSRDDKMTSDRSGRR